MDGCGHVEQSANYTIAGVTITNVSVASNHRTVELDLNPMPTLPLTVTVTGVKDLSGNAMAANSTAHQHRAAHLHAMSAIGPY